MLLKLKDSNTVEIGDLLSASRIVAVVVNMTRQPLAISCKVLKCISSSPLLTDIFSFEYI